MIIIQKIISVAYLVFSIFLWGEEIWRKYYQLYCCWVLSYRQRQYLQQPMIPQKKPSTAIKVLPIIRPMSKLIPIKKLMHHGIEMCISIIMTINRHIRCRISTCMIPKLIQGLFGRSILVDIIWPNSFQISTCAEAQTGATIISRRSM